MVPALLRIKKIAAKHTEPGSWSITTWWDEVVAKHGERTALVYNNRRYTYLDLDERSNQYARMIRELTRISVLAFRFDKNRCSSCPSQH